MTDDPSRLRAIGRSERTVPNPALFMFPVTEYRVLEAPEDLAEWEKVMREKFGLDVDARRPQGTHSFCGCVTGDQPGWDDTDTDDPF
jgi:hypothetical protein